MSDVKLEGNIPEGLKVAEMPRLAITEAQATVLRLEPGDVLAVKLKGDDFNHIETLNSLREQMSQLFPNNKVLLFSMDTGHEIEFNVVKQGESQ